MKKLIIILILVAGNLIGFAQKTEVTTHDREFINTDPSKGVKSFMQWGEFPQANKEIRRIQMHLTLAYPSDAAIAHWDYMDRVKIRRRGGADAKDLDLEIGRMLTPYGSNFKPGWSYTWTVDVTDFQHLLRDSVEIEYMHSGYEDPKLGWDLTLSFEIDYGRPVADLIKMERMWTGGFQYGNPKNPIEKQLRPIKIKKEEGSSFGRFRIQHTGHGMDQPNGCSEFCSRWRELYVDGQVVDHRDIWKECGDNPLYPQGGTWIFDRGYWCPGDLQVPDIIDIPLTASKHKLDLNMKPFTANNIKQPKEQITSYFFQYREPNSSNDVRIEEIIAPNKKDNYNRSNPRGFDALITIRNLGKETLRSLDITYYTKGFEKRQYHWTGELGFYGSAGITLPGIIDATPGSNDFIVSLSAPNGKKDEWEKDNTMETVFDDIPVIPSSLVVDFLTNLRPGDNSLYIVNSDHDTVFGRTPGELEAATRYKDSLRLAEGNYYMELVDTAGEGLEFWFMPQAGFGKLQLRDIEDNIIELFESDNGNGLYYGFRTDNEACADTNAYHLAVNIFPRMVKDHLDIIVTSNKTSLLKAVITRDGEYIETHEFTNLKDSVVGLDTKHLKPGRYVMGIYINEEHKMNRRFNIIDRSGH